MFSFNLLLTVNFILIVAYSHQANGQGESCYTPDNRFGVCVVLPQCPSIVSLYGRNQGNPQIVNYLFGAQRNCGRRSIRRNPIVCCNDPVSYNPPFPSPQPRPRPMVFPDPVPTNNPEPRPPPINFPGPQPVLPELPPPIIPEEQTTEKRTTTSTTTTTTTTTTTQAPPPTSTSRVIDGTCQDPNGERGICKSIRECPVVLNEFVARQSDSNYINFIKRSNAVCNNIQPNICCPFVQESFVTQKPTRPTSPPQAKSYLQGRLLTIEEGCGFSNATHKRIVGGGNAKKGAYPWMTLLGYTNNLGETSWKCGGSLITTSHVLTAAHCITSTLKIARLGEHDISSTSDGEKQDIKIVRAVRHPDYDKHDGTNDLAVLYLERDADLSLRVGPICLPTQEPIRSRQFVGYQPFVAGWGRLQEGGKSSNILQELQIPILDNEVCKDRYQKQNKLLSDKQFGSAVLCAGVLTGGHDSCQGDSGGPLMQPINSNGESYYHQIGIVSYGIGCARTDVPGVYTRVQNFVDWIQDRINE